MSEEKSNSKSSNGIYLFLILILLIGLGFMSYLWSNKNKELNQCSNENAELLADMQGMNDMMSGYVENNGEELKRDLRNDLKRMLETYDALKEKDASKADSINMQKEKIQNLMNQLNTNKKLSAKQLFQLRKENETLRNIMKGYVKQIDSLNTLNLQLSSDLETKTTQLNSTIEERNQYKSEAEKNAEQVKRGSKLSAYNFNTVGLRMKLNNTPEETSKAKNCVQIRSSFTIGENSLTTPGNKIVYMQIMSPEGRILQTRASNVVQIDGVSIAYSDKKEINYNNQSIDLSIYYDFNGEEALKGNYKVKIFCDGQMIGSDSFTLK